MVLNNSLVKINKIYSVGIKNTALFKVIRLFFISFEVHRYYKFFEIIKLGWEFQYFNLIETFFYWIYLNFESVICIYV